ncbi:type I 3-dehydroquinate dehydratase [uncultured Amnibacterium sp.]|uniref:type I 3-dehydroquinate dehydratase n=1 Tax=uncultured Amnibacterium sp. TaxID=1631851 RepID=UPI0035CAF872
MTVAIGGVVLGPGRPRVCVPLTGATVEVLEAEARAIEPGVADLIELRIDRLAALDDPAAVRGAIGAVRAALHPGLPILLTCRTAAEGGGAHLAPQDLRDLLLRSLREQVDAVDVEMALPAAVVTDVVDAAHAAGTPVVLSFHDLRGTPSREEVVERLVRQQAQGADVVKLACTPATADDVLTLLGATLDYTARPDARPAVTMAMGPLGVVSRLAGETFGSVLTFGTVGAASAPGQVDAGALRGVLDLLHGAQTR